MDAHELETILKSVAEGKVTPKEAFDSLKTMTYDDIDIAKVDSFRALRQGFPEVIFGPGKTAPQIIKIVEALLARQNVVIATKVDNETAEQVLALMPHGRYEETAQMLLFGDASKCELNEQGGWMDDNWGQHEEKLTGLTASSSANKKTTVNTNEKASELANENSSETQRSMNSGDFVSIVTAGTADIAVAEEAALYLVASGMRVHRVTDVGVAGIHRLFPHIEELNRSQSVIVIAGMDGALASVLGGLLAVPIIAVPTSVGYGASFQGLSALLAMLSSCAAGLTVVNIDNGFGAAMAALRISNLKSKKLKPSAGRLTDIG